MATYLDVRNAYLSSRGGLDAQQMTLEALMNGLRVFMKWPPEQWTYTDASPVGSSTSKGGIKLIIPPHVLHVAVQAKFPANRKTGMFAIADVVVTVAGKEINVNPDDGPSIEFFNQDASDAILALAIRDGSASKVG